MNSLAGIVKNNFLMSGEARGRGGVAKMGIWGDFQGLTEATGGGRGVKKFENCSDVVY